MSTEDALEDRDVCAFFKGWTAVAAPFLMAHLTDLVTDFAVFAAFFTDNIVLEAMECIDGKEWDKWRYNEDHDNTEFWWLIVQTAMQTFRRGARLIYPRLMRDPGQAVALCFTLGMILNVWAYLALSRIIIRKPFFLTYNYCLIFSPCALLCNDLLVSPSGGSTLHVKCVLDSGAH